MSDDISPELILDLLRDGRPDLAGLPVSFAARGWDNQLWRLGDDLAVRLPWATEGADALLRKEHAWLPGLAPLLPLPVPVPQHLGEPSEAFPRHWLVTTWVPGDPADRAPATRPEAADTLAAFLTALHRPAPSDAPTGRGRGGRLSDVREPSGLSDALRAVWADAVAAPEWTGPAVWLHGDLHSANVLTGDGTISGVIDFGDLYAGDPAWDLTAAWLLLPDGGADRFFARYETDEATVRRARGWAVLRALMLIAIAEDDGPGGKPTWGPPALAALRRLEATVH